MTQVGDIWFRYDDSDQEWTRDPYEWQLTVTRLTAKCAVLDVYGKEKFVLLDARKRFAYPTRELAIESYIIRKSYQASRASAVHERATDNHTAAIAFRDRGFVRERYDNTPSHLLVPFI